MSIKYILTQMYNQDISAVFEDNRCTDINVYRDDDITGNIYVGRVENIISDINCAFVEIAKGVKCYYSLNDNKKHIFINPKNNNELKINDYILVQILRGPMKTKPATATCNITLTGEYVVLNTDVSGISVSSKIKDKKKIAPIISALGKHTKNNKFGFIIRTNVSNLTTSNDEILDEHSIDIVYKESELLSDSYNEIMHKAQYAKCFSLIYKAPPAYIKYIKQIDTAKDYEVVTDNLQMYDEIKNAFGDSLNIRLYQDEMLPLYKLYSLEKEFDHALSKKVWLKCGGYIIIEQTEALTVVDVNSGKCVIKRADKKLKEKTFLKVNLEAAREIAYQMRLRNLSGIIIIDFINMTQADNNKELIQQFSSFLKEDHLKASVEDITKLGLVEVTRQKTGKTLYENIGMEYLNAKK